MPETLGGAFSGAKREHLYKHIREGAKRQRMVRRLLAVYLVVLPIAIAVGSPQPAQASPAAVPANPPPTTPAVPIDWVAHLHGSETPAGGPGTTTFDASIADGPGSCASGFVSGSVICNVTSGAVSSGTLTGPFTDCNNITYTATEPALTGNNNFLDFLTSPVAGYPEGQVGEVDVASGQYTTNCPDGSSITNSLAVFPITGPSDCTPFTLSPSKDTASGSCSGNAGGPYSFTFTISATYPSVDLNLAATVRLLQPDVLTATVSPRTAHATSYTFEWRKPTDDTWTKLSEGPSASYTLKPKIAAHLQVRVVAIIYGQSIPSAPAPLTVLFPTWSQIFGNATVKGFATTAWNQTLATTTRLSRGERCFWILLDTATGQYSKTATVVTNVGPKQTGHCNLPAPPPDKPTSPSLSDSPVYTVAWFHTHTPTTYRSVGRPVGPSDKDIKAASFYKMPGAAYDYVGAPGRGGYIPAGWPLRAPAKLWPIPPVQRPTP